MNSRCSMRPWLPVDSTCISTLGRYLSHATTVGYVGSPTSKSNVKTKNVSRHVNHINLVMPCSSRAGGQRRPTSRRSMARRRPLVCSLTRKVRPFLVRGE